MGWWGRSIELGCRMTQDDALKIAELAVAYVAAMKKNAETKYLALKTDYGKKYNAQVKQNPHFADYAPAPESVFTADVGGGSGLQGTAKY